MTKTSWRKVGFASLIMMGSVFLSRIIGLLREMVIASKGGATGAVDAYQISFVIPEILNHIAASGFLSVTFIPIFSHYLVKGKSKAGWNAFWIIFNGLGVLLLVLIALALVWAPELVSLFGPGLEDPAVIAAAVRMTRIIIPAQFFFFTGGLFMAVQFANERFLIPALAPLIYNFGIIIGGIVLAPQLGMEGFSWGVLAGAIIGNFVIQYFGARKVGMPLMWRFDLGHPDFKKYLLLTLPLMVGLTMTFSTELFFKIFASFLPPGSIASINYALRIMFILVGLSGQAVGMATYPFMAKMAAQKNFTEMNRLLNQTLRYLALVIPFAVLFMVLRSEIVTILYQHGRFDAAATAMTAKAFFFLAPGAAAFAAQTVVVRGFYAIQNTLYPALFSTACVLGSIPLYIAGLKIMGAPGICLTVTLATTLQVFLLFALWNRRSHNPESLSVYGFYLKIIALSVPLGLLLEAARWSLSAAMNAAGFIGNMGVSLIIGGLFLGGLWLFGRIFNIKEIVELTSIITKMCRAKVFRGKRAEKH